MIAVNLENPSHRQAWSLLNSPNLDIIEKNESPSVLESILESEMPDLYRIVACLRESMRVFWKDPIYQHAYVRKKDISHNRRILLYVEQLLFPRDEAWRNGRLEVRALYDLDYFDLFSLLCAVYVHDYGKGQFKLLLPEVPEPHRQALRKVVSTSDPNLDFGLLESYHTWVISVFLKHFADCWDTGKDASKLRESLASTYTDEGLQSYINEIRHNSGFDWKRSPQDGADAERTLFYLLYQVVIAEAPRRNLCHEIRVISRSHKAYKKMGEAEIDFFDQIKDSKLRLLSAILRLADNLDLTSRRLEEKGALPDQYSAWMASGTEQNWPETYEQIFRKWLTFDLVREAEISHKIAPFREGHPPCAAIEIVLKYKAFARWPEYLLPVRKQVEKDFFATSYLDELVKETDLIHTQLRLFYEVSAPTPGKIYPVEDKLNGLTRLKWESQKRPGASERFSLWKASPNKGVSLLKFSPLDAKSFSPAQFSLPTSQSLLYLLTYLLESPDQTAKTKEIARQSGLDFQAAQWSGETLPGNLFQLKQDLGEVSLTDEGKRHAKRLYDTLRAKPAWLREKVREVQEFGEVLPFNRRDSELIATGIDGLDQILSHQPDHKRGGFRNSRNILLVGGPGTGKTTFLAHFVNWNACFAAHRAIMLTLEELASVLAQSNKDNYGWELDQLVNVWKDEGTKEERRDAILDRFYQNLLRNNPDVIAIDGLSRLRWLFEKDEDYRSFVANLFRSLQLRGIASISTIEDPPSQRGPCEEYQADSVLHLYQGEHSRHIHIEKVRSQDFVRGLHSFEILNTGDIDNLEKNLRRPDPLAGSKIRPEQSPFPFKPGINVYPSQQFYAADVTARELSADKPCIATGLGELDKLLPGPGSSGGYRPGDSILVMGSPGAGKTLFGLHFLQEAAASEFVFWLSFEGPRSSLERSVESFDSAVKFRKLLTDEKRFIFCFIPPSLISPDKVLYLVMSLVQRYGLTRIVVDSVSEIQGAFTHTAPFRQYMTSLIHALACQNVTSMFLYRVPGFFQTTRETESEISSQVDTIITIKTFDMKNQIRRGLFVLKSRGRELRSQLQTMMIDPKEGIRISFKGWEMEGLLSGDTGSIYEPEVFLKHFYENPPKGRLTGNWSTSSRHATQVKGALHTSKNQRSTLNSGAFWATTGRAMRISALFQ